MWGFLIYLSNCWNNRRKSCSNISWEMEKLQNKLGKWELHINRTQLISMVILISTWTLKKSKYIIFTPSPWISANFSRKLKLVYSWLQSRSKKYLLKDLLDLYLALVTNLLLACASDKHLLSCCSTIMEHIAKWLLR